MKGTALFDSIKIPSGFVYADSVRCRVLHVGDSSITIGSAPWFGTTTSGNNNNITCSNGQLNFGQSSVPFFGNITLNVGTTTNTYKLHLHDQSANANGAQFEPYIHFTNSVTNQTIGDGFIVGINSGAGADLINRENTDMHFFTSNAQRVSIKIRVLLV
jgi:hypothetical protein